MKKVVLFQVIALLCFFSPPVSALNCELAKTKTEQAICHNETLLALDGKLNIAYKTVMSSLREEHWKARFKYSQINWIKMRDECGDSQVLINCLTNIMKERINQLSIKSLDYKGIKLIPFIGELKDGSQSYKLYLLSGANESISRKFENAVVKFVPDTVATMASDDGCDTPYREETTLTLSYLKPVVLAFGILYSRDGCGMPHANYNTASHLFSLKDGEFLEFQDLFNLAMTDEITKRCREQILVKREGAPLDDAQDDTLKRGAIEISKWRFSDNLAYIEFDPYDVASYAEGFMSCEFSAGDMRKYLRADSPIKYQKD